MRAGASPHSLPLRLTAWALRGARESLVNGSLRLRGSGDHGPRPILTHLCPHVAQVHGSRLRLSQVSSADSGEYVCRVDNGSGSKEASITISVLHGAHSGSSHTSGEEPGGAGQGSTLGPPRYSQRRCLWSLWGQQERGGTRQAVTLHSLVGEVRGLRLRIRVIRLTWSPMMREMFSEFIEKQQDLG